MKYIIDGYNLIGKLNSISLSDSQKEDKCISYLQNLPSKTQDRFYCVFDGKSKYSDYKSVQTYASITVIYTDPAQSADSYIINYCDSKKNRSGIIGVSSDNDILYNLRKLKVKTLTCHEFINYFSTYQKSGNDKTDLFSDDEDIDFWLKRFS